MTTNAHGQPIKLHTHLGDFDSEEDYRRALWSERIHAERATHAEKGYTVEHDRVCGPNHLIDWAIDYARRGKTVEAAALMLALRELLAAVPPVTSATPQPFLALISLAEEMLEKIEGEWGMCRSYAELVSQGDADARVIEAARAAPVPPVTEEPEWEYGLMFKSHYEQSDWTPKATVMSREDAEQYARESSGRNEQIVVQRTPEIPAGPWMRVLEGDAR